jgi:hypothetical protein
VVKYGGTDPSTGSSKSSTEDLGFVLDYGKQDWQEVALALREFVSNAIDRSIRGKSDWSGVKIEIVDEGQVRAKRDHMLNGYYRDGVVFINADLAGSGSVVAGRLALSDRLVKVALEETVHYVSGSLDNSRDIQGFLLDLAVKVTRSNSNKEVGA